MKPFNIIVAIFLLAITVKAKLIYTYDCPSEEECKILFMDYLSSQKRIVTTEGIGDQPIYYVRDRSLMPGFGLRFSPDLKKGFLYEIQKDYELDTEQEFFI